MFRESVTQSLESWDKIYAQQGKVFTEPHEDLPKFVQSLRKSGASTILDLGCGSGRHVIYLARCGFSVFGIDNSQEGLKITRKWLNDERLDADLQLHSMTDKLPYQNSFFDAVLSTQVIHHADIATIKGIVKEVSRVLKSDGFLFITVPSIRNQGTTFKQLEPNTFIPLDGPEKGIPHHYFTPEELREVFDGFEMIDIHLDMWDHYCMFALKG